MVEYNDFRAIFWVTPKDIKIAVDNIQVIKKFATTT